MFGHGSLFLSHSCLFLKETCKFAERKIEDQETMSSNNLEQFDPSSVVPDKTDDDRVASVDKQLIQKICWRNVVIFAYLHMCALYGIHLCSKAKYQTLIFGTVRSATTFFILKSTYSLAHLQLSFCMFAAGWVSRQALIGSGAIGHIRPSSH